MKRFEFALDGMLNLKRQREQLAELEQMKAKRAVDLAENAIVRIQQELRNLGKRAKQLVGSAVNPGDWGRIQVETNRLGELLQAAQRELVKAKARYIEISSVVADMHREVEILEVLREERKAEYRKEQKRAESKDMEEVGLRRWKPPVRHHLDDVSNGATS